ncbi:uncharacterized protein LOC112689628 [Sipha flava]|uniref:Uncharacterized protein LOC112689628 n=1 Tax=Sipha flava TaxID=143950 RepID=A0A2S2QN88_9HEMI|nr:uncharacterized protein LOC112689628 [Sipha flava]
MSRFRQIYGDDKIAAVLQELEDKVEVNDADPIADFSDDSEGEDEVILPNDQSSDSELSIDERDSNPPPSVSLNDNADFDVFIGKNGETFWFSNALALPKQKIKSKNIVKILPGPTGFSREAKSEKDIFLKFFPLEIIDKIVLCTNKFIDKRANKIHNRCIELGNEFRSREFKTTTRGEMLALIGIFFYMATCKTNRANTKTFWKTDGTGMVLFHAAMSYNRFFFLLQALQFDDLDTRNERQKSDKLAAVREMYTTFNENCMKNYSSSEFVTIDEMLYAFRGRCGFIQYMPTKPENMDLNFTHCAMRKHFMFIILRYIVANKNPDSSSYPTNHTILLCDLLNLLRTQNEI